MYMGIKNTYIMTNIIDILETSRIDLEDAITNEDWETVQCVLDTLFELQYELEQGSPYTEEY